MYKARFKKWGLNKYLKANELDQARREAKKGKIDVPVIRGRLLGSDLSSASGLHHEEGQKD
jgi:hypothetical protein